MTAFLRGVYAIVVLDLKRAWLDRARVLAGLAQPLLYLFVLGQGLGANSRMSGRGFLPFIFPGVIGLNLLMTSTMAAITIVFDRQIGFFKAVLVAPIPRSALALGKILSGAVQAFLQAALLLPFAPAVGITNPWAVLQLGCVMFFSATVFSSISVALAARFTSTTVFPIVNNAFVLPMFFLSGALYPLALAPH